MGGEMQKDEIPCKGCLKLPVCKHKVQIECSDLFFIILDHADFDEADRIKNKVIRGYVKDVLQEVEHILPGRDWRERYK